MFLRLAEQHRAFIRNLVMDLQALAIVLERRGYLSSCYTCGGDMNSASFMVSLNEGQGHLIRFLVSDYGITWTEMRDDRELMKLEGAEAISQLQELANLIKFDVAPETGIGTVTNTVAKSAPTPAISPKLQALNPKSANSSSSAELLIG